MPAYAIHGCDIGNSKRNGPRGFDVDQCRDCDLQLDLMDTFRTYAIGLALGAGALLVKSDCHYGD
jgi:hypothetical protein